MHMCEYPFESGLNCGFCNCLKFDLSSTMSTCNSDKQHRSATEELSKCREENCDLFWRNREDVASDIWVVSESTKSITALNLKTKLLFLFGKILSSKKNAAVDDRPCLQGLLLNRAGYLGIYGYVLLGCLRKKQWQYTTL